MAFVKAHIEIKSASVGTGIKCSLKRTNKSAARMSFVLSAAVAKELDWSNEAKLEVLIGEGEHHGLIRLRKNNSAGEAAVEQRATAKGEWFNIRLGHQPSFVDRSEAAAWCQWEKVEDGWIEIVLPRWADETAPNRKQAASPVPNRVPQPQPQAGRANVTANLMGDPPPGRREMLAKVGKIAAE